MPCPRDVDEDPRERAPEPATVLLEALRHDLGLTDGRQCRDKSDRGACTVRVGAGLRPRAARLAASASAA